jgi:hypothetical protein
MPFMMLALVIKTLMINTLIQKRSKGNKMVIEQPSLFYGNIIDIMKDSSR